MSDYSLLDVYKRQVLETPDVAAVNKYANVQEIYEALKCNVSCRGYEPVSYTHLDVYKRQEGINAKRYT